MGTRREPQSHDLMNAYSMNAKLLLLLIVGLLALWLFTGCAGYTDNAKSIHFQVPALLDVEFQYNDQKGITDPPDLKGIFKATPQD